MNFIVKISYKYLNTFWFEDFFKGLLCVTFASHAFDFFFFAVVCLFVLFFMTMPVGNVLHLQYLT